MEPNNIFILTFILVTKEYFPIYVTSSFLMKLWTLPLKVYKCFIEIVEILNLNCLFSEKTKKSKEHLSMSFSCNGTDKYLVFSFKFLVWLQNYGKFLFYVKTSFFKDQKISLARSKNQNEVQVYNWKIMKEWAIHWKSKQKIKNIENKADYL